MTPVIRISEATYNKMKLVAEPFVDTPDVVISRCLDEVLASRGLTPATIPAAGAVRRLAADHPGDLSHTSVKSVRIGDEPLAKAHWNGLLRQVHLLALEQLGSFAALQAATNSKVREGSYEDDGFHYVVEGDFSIQGQDSNLCWANSLKLARTIPIALAVEFTWQQREGAAHPGEAGTLEWHPDDSA
jgi:hypothetical protein